MVEEEASSLAMVLYLWCSESLDEDDFVLFTLGPIWPVMFVVAVVVVCGGPMMKAIDGGSG